MRIHFVSPLCLEPWDYRALEKGIGGSETSHICLAMDLAQRGHDVCSYTWLPDDCPDTGHAGVHWRSLEDLPCTDDGDVLWIVYRAPFFAEKIEPAEGQKLWLVVQDVDCPGWKPEHTAQFDKILGLCDDHLYHLGRAHPEAAGKLVKSSNAVQTWRFRDLEAEEAIERDPKRLIWASSPDRGLDCLLDIFQRAREFCDGLTLHVFYGFNNLDKMTADKPKDRRKRAADKLKARMDEPGVVWHGRVGQDQLYREYLKSGIWCYPTEFTETSCVTCMEAQCGGAVPITNPIWALSENVRHGVFLQGNPYGDPLVRARYAQTIAMIANAPALQEMIRDQMVLKARGHRPWGAIGDQWDNWVQEYEGKTLPDGCRPVGRFAFQHKHANGKILNIGCDADYGGMRFRDATNLDYLEEHPMFPGEPGFERFVDVLGDARDLPTELHGQYDSVILGDILEHMEYPDIVTSLKQAKLCLRNGGPVVVTWPLEDGESYEKVVKMGIPVTPRGTEYAPGCRTDHTRIIPLEQMRMAIDEAGMTITWQRKYEEGTFAGWGVVAC